MQVLGDLISLPHDRDDLPLPWWHRAPLGFQTNTQCYISLVEGRDRPVGDLIVSVLDPYHRHRMIRVECRRRDQPGVVAGAVEVVSDVNIALAESITMEGGALHDLTLICEPIKGRSHFQIRSGFIKRKLKEEGFERVRIDHFPQRHVKWTDKGEVQHGWLTKTEWKGQITRRYRKVAEKIDLTKVVVSADTDERLLRFIFPYKGAKTIAIEHADRPGSLKILTQILVDRNLNLLSTLLRRGGAKSGNAVLVAICEPKDGTDVGTVFEQVEEDLDRLPPENLVKVRINDGIKAASTICPTTPDAVVANIPSRLLHDVRIQRSRLEENRIPVFFSRRFTNDKRAEQIAQSVRDVLVSSGCIPLEASPEQEPRAPLLIFNEVSAKMWVAEAAIVLVVDLSGADALGKNLPHEAGFFYGQSKPVLLLVEGGQADSLRDWSNIQGIYAPRFAEGARAFDATQPDSIRQIVEKWVKNLGD